jgi:hypothetical protein
LLKQYVTFTDTLHKHKKEKVFVERSREIMMIRHVKSYDFLLLLFTNR